MRWTSWWCWFRRFWPVFWMANCINIWINAGNKFTSTGRNHSHAWRQKLLISKGSDQSHYTCSKEYFIFFHQKQSLKPKRKFYLFTIRCPWGDKEETNSNSSFCYSNFSRFCASLIRSQWFDVHFLSLLPQLFLMAENVFYDLTVEKHNQRHWNCITKREYNCHK